MKNINKKGFVLAETIVVGVFIMGLLTFLILNVLPLVGEYEKVENYDNLDKKYDVHLIRKMILMENNPTTIQKILSVGTKGYQKYDKIGFCNEFKNNKEYCTTLLGKDYLDVKSIIITYYQTSNVKKDAINFNRSLQEYISYIPTNDVMTSIYTRYQGYKRIIVEFNDGKFANIEVKYEGNE